MWKTLADNSGEEFPADMALDLASSNDPPNTDALYDAYLTSGTLESDQMSIMVAPWKEDAWRQFGEDATSVSQNS